MMVHVDDHMSFHCEIEDHSEVVVDLPAMFHHRDTIGGA
jgi:hypothetical protein